MNPIAKIGIKAPALKVSTWVQGKPCTLDQLLGTVVLIEVFQVNCPGCFLYSIPQAIDLHQRYHNKGLTVIGLATAFEDFDKNTLDNLKLLLKQNQVIGQTRLVLEQNNRLINGQLPFHIPFPVAMDNLSKTETDITATDITAFINQHMVDFKYQNEQQQKNLEQQVSCYLKSRVYNAETFTTYALNGTPSHLLVDKKGILRASELGDFPDLEWLLNSLLQE